MGNTRRHQTVGVVTPDAQDAARPRLAPAGRATRHAQGLIFRRLGENLELACKLEQAVFSSEPTFAAKIKQFK